MIYTLKSLLECSTRAVMLAQPADILKFESQYFLELLDTVYCTTLYYSIKDNGTYGMAYHVYGV
uniref:RIIa domain-containing protein n=1 Tax=Poecilia mexicana TaxID=48701 RepID=A0A3B3WIF9_9TELE